MNISRQIRNAEYDRKHPISHVGWVDPFAGGKSTPPDPDPDDAEAVTGMDAKDDDDEDNKT